MNASPTDLTGRLSELMHQSVDARLEAVRATATPNETIASLAEEAERLGIVDLSAAMAATAMVIDLADALGDLAVRGRARRARGQVLAYANRFEEALGVLNQAAELSHADHKPVEAARAQLTTLHALARLGRFDDAIVAGEAARIAFVHAGETVLAGRADINLGVTHRMRDDPATALALFERARPVFVSSNPMIAAQLDSNRAEALLDLNRFAEAEDAFNAALKAFEAAGTTRAAAIVEGNLADLMSRQGRLERASYHFERARRYLEADTAPGDLARLTAEQGETLALIGLLDEALINYQQAVPILREHGLAWEAARATAGLGRILLRSGRSNDAAVILNHAADAFQRLHHHTGYAQIRLLQGEAAREAGDTDQARLLLGEALQLLVQRPADAAAARCQLAILHLEAGDLETADHLLDSALGTATQLNLAPLLADLHHARARLRTTQGHLPLALTDLRAAVNQIERIRGTLQADRFRAAFLGDRMAIYEDLVAALVELGGHAHLAEAFAVVEQAKSRSLLDLLKGAIDIADTTSADAEDLGESRVLEELVRLRGELNALYTRLDGVASDDRRRPLGFAWQQQIERCERSLAAVEGRLAATRGVGSLFAPAIELPAAQRLLASTWAIVEYFIARGQLLAFVVRHDSIGVFVCPSTIERLRESVERLQFQLSRAVVCAARGATDDPRMVADTNAALGELHAQLLGPLSEALVGVERLIVVPHGPLHAVPFHALWDGARHLIQDMEVLYSPSASVLEHLRARGTAAPTDVATPLLVGVPDEATPQIESEITKISGTLDRAKVLLGHDATVARFTDAVRTAPIIHIACHGRFSASSPMSSGLKLADRWMTIRDLYALRLDGSWVTLSGCDTGLSAVTGGDELVGLVRGFFAAGAATLITSLWTLSDQSAANLMASVYDACYTNGRKNAFGLARALREAQCRMMQQHPHPVHWAPFVLAGNS